MANMDTEFTEEEVVENPTLKAAYNLAPLHQNQPLRWDYEVDLIGKKVYDKVLHLCEVCEFPVLVYGRLLPCKHIFCFLCARKCEEDCKRCGIKVQKVEELALGTVYVCTFGAPKHSTNGCRRTYLSHRDLQSHIAHRHFDKPSSNESKASSNVQQPQLPLTQQQAAALQQHASSQAVATPHSQANLLPSMQGQQPHPQQNLPTSPFVQHHQHSPHDIGHQQQMMAPAISGLAATSVSPAVSQMSPDPKSNFMMPHGLAYNTALQTSDQQGAYRPLDNGSLPHPFQQLLSPPQPVKQHSQHLSQQHLQLPLSQQQSTPPSQLMQHSGSSGMPPMSKPLKGFNHPMQNIVSSSMLSMQGSHSNAFQATASSSLAEMHMSTQMHHQPPRQNVNLHLQQQQQHVMPHHSTQQHLVHKNYNEVPSDMDNFDRLPKRDNFGNPRQGNFDDNDKLHSGATQNRDGFNPLHQQRKLFNPLQDMDDRDRDFNIHQSSMMDSSSTQSGQSSRNKNVNLITVPIQDEGQYRPLPYVNQSQLPPGSAGSSSNKNFAPFSSSMPVSNIPPSNFSYSMNTQAMGSGGGGNIRPSQRMPFSRSSNPQSRMPGPGSPQGNMMMNNPRGIGPSGGGVRLALGTSVPPNVQGALAGAVQGLNRNTAPLHTPLNNPRFNPPHTSGHWPVSVGPGAATSGGNLRPLQPRGNNVESQFKQQGYYR